MQQIARSVARRLIIYRDHTALCWGRSPFLLWPSLSGGLMFITVMPRQLSKPLSWNRTKFVRSYLKPVSRLIKLHKKMKPFPDELDDKIAGEAGVHEYVVSTGDTLSSILNQYGIDMGDITQLAAADKELRNLKIGQQLSGH